MSQLVSKELVKETEKIQAEKKPEPEYIHDEKPLVLVFRTKPRPITYLRAKPRTAYNPTVPQIKARLRFAELAKKAKGKKFKVDGKFVSQLPPAAEAVKAMKGEKFGKTVKMKKWQLILAEYLRRFYGEAFRHS